MKFLLSLILIIASVGLFLAFINPTYVETEELKQRADSYTEALNNARTLQSVRDALVAKYNSLPPQSLDRLQKFLPDNVDNIKLVLEIDRIASQYGMQVQNIKYDTLAAAPAAPPRGQFAETAAVQMKDYNDFDMEFSVEGSYVNFIGFLESLEKSLRVVDPQSIEFSSTQVGVPGADIYKYDFKVKTYWLKKA